LLTVGPRRTRGRRSSSSSGASVPISNLRAGTRFYVYEDRRLPKVEVKGRSVKVRLKDPGRFTTYRTKDVGRPGKTQLVLGYNPRTKEWETQAVKFDMDELKKNKETQELFEKAIRGEV